MFCAPSNFDLVLSSGAVDFSLLLSLSLSLAILLYYVTFLCLKIIILAMRHDFWNAFFRF